MSFRCPNDAEHDIFIVHPGSEEEDPDALGVQVWADGRVSNARGDGVIGVPETLRELAGDEVDAICAFCSAEVEWQREETP